MEKRCPHCNALINEHANVCPYCGKSVPSANAVVISLNLKGECVYSIAALVLSILLLALCCITAFVDSATFINSMYTTALEWNLPLVTIALVIIAFVTNRREGKATSLNVTLVFLVVAFCLSNPNKNMIQDHVSNAENYVEIYAEAIRDEAENLEDWVKTIREAINDAGDELRKSSRQYDDYDDYDDYDYYDYEEEW